MPNPTLQRLLKKIGNPDLLSALGKLPMSDLNSLLMEVFRIKVTRQEASDLMQSYKTNRFVTPSSLDVIPFLREELQLLKEAEQNGFQAIELSPLAPMGSCSSIACVNQNKIISAIRGTEVVADATNVLALRAALLRIQSGFDEKMIHSCSVHRHVRAQAISGKGFTPHFKIFCALSAGKDTGNFEFEKEVVVRHLLMYRRYLCALLKPSDVKFVFKTLLEDGKENKMAAAVTEILSARMEGTQLSFLEVPRKEHRYYHGLRFSINVIFNEKEYNIADGGFVDWAEKLTGNKKERLFTSGLGTELLFKLLQDKI